ncbi:MAG: response regulator [Bacteroidota bacterium]
MTEKPELLLIEDDPLNVFIITEHFSDRFMVSAATNSDEALELASARSFDAIISDENLGNFSLTGSKTCVLIKASLRKSAPYMVLLSGYSYMDEGTDYPIGLFDEKLVKPTDLDELKERILNAVGHGNA